MQIKRCKKRKKGKALKSIEKKKIIEGVHTPGAKI